MTSSPELPVPDAALIAHDFEAGSSSLAASEASVRRIALPVVAAELRSWDEAAITPVTNTGQNEYERGVQAGVRIAAQRLRARADEIERQQP